MPHAALLLFVLCLTASCDKLDSWRDGQVAQSGQVAQGSKVTAPAQPITVPDSVRRELPLDDAFTVLTYSAQGEVAISALSPWDAQQTALWLVGRLGELGYDSGDNASRVLEGATYSKASGEFRTLYVKLGLNTAEQCTVEYRASK